MSENSLRIFGNFDKKLTNRLSVFMEKRAYFPKNLSGPMEYAWKKIAFFLWNNHMEKHVPFVYDGYNRYNNRLSLQSGR